jgi:DNA-binding transcriptional ArsR family regulator
MVEQSSPLDAVFHALADPTRRAMLTVLSTGECSVKALAEPHAMSLAGAAKHVQVLERAGLVRRRKSGRHNLIALEAQRLREAHRWIAYYQRFWNRKLDALHAALERGDDP